MLTDRSGEKSRGRLFVVLLATIFHILSHSQQIRNITLLNDLSYCQMQVGVSREFCLNDLPTGRAHIRSEALQARQHCPPRKIAWEENLTEPLSLYQMYAVNRETDPKQEQLIRPCWQSQSIVARYSPHLVENITYHDTNAMGLQVEMGHTEQGDPKWLHSQHVVSCTTAHVDGSNWTFERFGPFKGDGGYGWHGGARENVGQFRDIILEGAVYVTAFGFYPVDESGAILGMPPIHIHHMHVTAAYCDPTQCTCWDSFINPVDPGFQGGLPFDVHGDRQCTPEFGGTDCLVRAYPRGYGVPIPIPLRTYFDLNDARPAQSSALGFFAEHAFRWTHSYKRPVGRFVANVRSNVAGHDDYMIAAVPGTSMMAWDERDLRHLLGSMYDDISFVHVFWHTHRALTEDTMAFRATAKQVGLGTAPFEDKFVNLKRFNLTVMEVRRYIFQHLADARHRSRDHERLPTFWCSLSKRKVFENIPNNVQQERYHAPHCNEAFEIAGLPVLTLVSFHSPQTMLSAEDLRVPKMKWMHSVMYAFYVPRELVRS